MQSGEASQACLCCLAFYAALTFRVCLPCVRVAHVHVCARARQPLGSRPEQPVKIQIMGAPRSNAAAKDSGWVSSRQVFLSLFPSLLSLLSLVLHPRPSLLSLAHFILSRSPRGERSARVKRRP